MLKKNRDYKPLNKTLLLSLGIPIIFIPGLILASILGWDWPRTDLTSARGLHPRS